MRLRVDRVFLEQAERYRLAIGCEQCAYYLDPARPTHTGSRGCAHGYPNEAHRAAAFAREQQEAAFCKEWELADGP